MILRILTVAALAAVASPVFAAPATTILPGYWESTSKATLLTEGPAKVEKRCITPDQVNAYLSGPSTSRYTCAYSEKIIRGGVASFKGVCTDKHGQAFNVTLHGTYSPEAFHMDAELTLPNLPIGGSAVTDAHRLSATCPTE